MQPDWTPLGIPLYTPSFKVLYLQVHVAFKPFVDMFVYLFILLKGLIMNHLVRAQDTQKVTDCLLEHLITWRGITALKAVCQIYQISAGNLLSYFAVT